MNYMGNKGSLDPVTTFAQMCPLTAPQQLQHMMEAAFCAFTVTQENSIFSCIIQANT